MKIGNTLTVNRAHNHSIEGTTGKVVDETKNTLVLDTETGRKTIIKEQVIAW